MLARQMTTGRAPTAARPATATRTSVRSFAAGTGFGKTGKKADAPSKTEGGSGMYTSSTRKKRVDIAKELGQNAQDAAPVAAPKPRPTDPDVDLTKGNWFPLGNANSDFKEKPRKLCELKGNKTMVVLHKYNDSIFAMNAFSTAYQYPLLDGKLQDGANGPTIETPLDGTVYDLKSGKVVKWCPSDGSPIRGLLRSLKADVTPIPLPVYPVVVKSDGTIMVRLSNK